MENNPPEIIMPQMANVTVKDAEAKDVLFKVMSQSAGDNSFAQWRGPGASLNTSATLRAKAAYNGDRSGRIVSVNGHIPVTRLVNGEQTLIAAPAYKYEFRFNGALTDAEVTNAAHIAANLIASALLKEVASTGIAPN